MKWVSVRKSQGHTYDEACCKECIQDIAESCDNEYYMSAIGPKMGNLERAIRGRDRIKQWITDLERLRENVSCSACRNEIKQQIPLQKKAIQEIEDIWGMDE